MKEKDLEKILKALANRRRLLIIKTLKKKGSSSVGDLAETLKLSFKSTSKHLKVLSSADIVDKEQVNLTMLYFLPKNRHPLVVKLLSIY